MRIRKADKLRAYWSRSENDVMFHHPAGVQTSADGHLLCSCLYSERPRKDFRAGGMCGIVFDKSLLDELTARGYAITTLKFEISPQKGNARFTSRQADPTL
jgi:hypothetical protein